MNTKYAQAAMVRLACDHLNTYTKGAFYEVLPPQEARAIILSFGVLPHSETGELPQHR